MEPSDQRAPHTTRVLSPPLSSLDYEFFYRGLAEGQLLVQKCTNCAAFRNPPGPMCPHCRSLSWIPFPCRGIGSVHSYTIHYHPPLPSFEVPHAIALVDMIEGFRQVGSLRTDDLQTIRIGMPVAIEFMRSGEVAAFRFRPV